MCHLTVTLLTNTVATGDSLKCSSPRKKSLDGVVLKILSQTQQCSVSHLHSGQQSGAHTAELSRPPSGSVYHKQSLVSRKYTNYVKFTYKYDISQTTYIQKKIAYTHIVEQYISKASHP